ncbi:MAG: hypothetical protein FRX49_11806 [Trebouxia sp. A1-2]|nr:MAG: hypothetical protein FRX49_11806 [Trebouxia sp. A1-2]
MPLGRLKMGPVPVLEVVDTLLSCGLLSGFKLDAECFFTRLRIQRRLRTKSQLADQHEIGVGVTLGSLGATAEKAMEAALPWVALRWLQWPTLSVGRKWPGQPWPHPLKGWNLSFSNTSSSTGSPVLPEASACDVVAPSACFDCMVLPLEKPQLASTWSVFSSKGVITLVTVPDEGLSVTVAETGDEAVAGTKSGAWAAWSVEGVGAGALTAESEDSDLQEVVPETAGLPLAASDKELLLDADSWTRSLSFSQAAKGSKEPTKRLSITPVHQGWRGPLGCAAGCGAAVLPSPDVSAF